MPPRSARGAPAPIGQRAARDHPQGEAIPTLGGPRRRLRSRRVPVPARGPRRDAAGAPRPHRRRARGEAFLLYRDGVGAQVILPLGRRPGDDRAATRQRGRARLGLRGLPRARGARARGRRLDPRRRRALPQRHLRGRGAGQRAAPAARRRRRSSVGATTIAFCAAAGEASMPTVTSLGPHVSELLTPAQRRVLVALCRPFREGTFADARDQPADRRRAGGQRRRGQEQPAPAVRGVRGRRPPAEPEAREPRDEGAAQRRDQPAGAVMRREPALGEARRPTRRRRPPRPRRGSAAPRSRRARGRCSRRRG